MATILEVEKLTLDLPERERAALAANLLDSLTGAFSDEDEGIAEGLRRDEEIDANPDQAHLFGTVGFRHSEPAHKCSRRTVAWQPH